MEDRARILEDRVEGLARGIIETINQAEVPGRPDIRAELKEYAISLLQDAIVPAEPIGVAADETVDEKFNPLGMGIPLVFAGVVLFFLFPPVGMMLFAAAVVMIVWGVMASLLRR